jgi:anti-anti-sigma factor
MADNPIYRIEHCSDGYLIALIGRGTLRESPALRDFVGQCLEKRLRVVVELTDCVYLDSTFLGCLIGLHKQSLGLGGRLFRVFADEDCRLRLLCTSGLHRLFDFAAERPDTTGDGMALDFGHFDSRTLGAHVMTSHRLLADLGGEDADSFRAIADRLQKELGMPPSAN